MNIIQDKIIECEANKAECERIIEKLMIIRSMFNEEINKYLIVIEANRNRYDSKLGTLRKAQNIIEDPYEPSKNGWKDMVLLRDRYTCQKCGTTEDLTVHHIIPKSQSEGLKWVSSNGITLCDKCHKEWHSTHEVTTLTRVFFNWLSIR